jgi:hypothetical protein
MWGSEGIASLILYFDTRWSQVFSPMPWLHYVWGKSPYYPLNRKLGAAQSQSENFVEDKNLSILLRYEPWTVQFLAQSLSSLYCPSFLPRVSNEKHSSLWLDTYLKSFLSWFIEK